MLDSEICVSRRSSDGGRHFTRGVVEIRTAAVSPSLDDLAGCYLRKAAVGSGAGSWSRAIATIGYRCNWWAGSGPLAFPGGDSNCLRDVKERAACLWLRPSNAGWRGWGVKDYSGKILLRRL